MSRCQDAWIAWIAFVFYNVFFCPFLVVTSHWQGHVTSSLFILESVRLLIKFLLKKLLSKKKLIQIRKQDKSALDTFLA